MKHLRTSQISQEEYQELIKQSEMDLVKEKYDRPPYIGIKPEKAIELSVKASKTNIKILSKKLSDIDSFLKWFTNSDKFSTTIYLAILRDISRINKKLRQHQENLKEALEDAKILGIEIDG